jgi:hypothetical protein
MALVTVVAIAMASCPGSREPRRFRAPRILGPLHTSGTSIVDSSNRPIRFMGIQVSGMARGDGSPARVEPGPNACRGWEAPDQAQYQNIEAWGFNMVRVGISWANLEPTPPDGGTAGPQAHHYNTGYLKALDAIVRRFTGDGIAVVIEMGQNHWSPAFRNISSRRGIRCRGVGMPSWLYPQPGRPTITQAKLDFYANRDGVQQGFLDAWRFVAERYASNPMVVGFDMMNEPYTDGEFPPSELHLGALYRRVGAAIRSVNRDALLAFQDVLPRQTDAFGLGAPPPFRNVVYEFHLYSDDWGAGLRLADILRERATRWNVPLWIGEFDAFGYASPFGAKGDWAGDLSDMMHYCKENGIGWTEFTYDDRWFLLPGTNRPRPGLLQALAESV